MLLECIFTVIAFLLCLNLQNKPMCSDSKEWEVSKQCLSEMSWRKGGLNLVEKRVIQARTNWSMRDVFVGSHYLDMTLSAQVVDLCRLHLVDDLHQTCAVSQITIVQLHVWQTHKTNTSFYSNSHLLVLYIFTHRDFFFWEVCFWLIDVLLVCLCALNGNQSDVKIWSIKFNCFWWWANYNYNYLL